MTTATDPHPVPPYPFFDHAGPLPFAHRGGAAYQPNVGIENSLPAFANAVELGYAYLETDVHATSDGVAIAFHDHTLDRVTDRTGAVAELPWSEVSRARIGGRAPIPTLAELLRTWPGVRLNLDIKEANAVEPVARTVAELGAQDRVCLASFSGSRLRRTRALLGRGVASSLPPLGVLALWLPLPRWLGRWVVPDAPCAQVSVRLGPFRLVSRGFVRRAHRLGKQVHVWTIDDPDQMRELLDLGVDGLISDRIDVLRDVLRERGEWPTP